MTIADHITITHSTRPVFSSYLRNRDWCRGFLSGLSATIHHYRDVFCQSSYMQGVFAGVARRECQS